MNAPVIYGEGIGKRYRRGLVQSNSLLRDSLGRILKSPLRALRGQQQESFWALEGVSFEVHEGEVLGLIGRNGAGKTTLLKILSRITQPTAGWAEIHGRVGSLLEVGTGFHPELTGRENTFLSGAILGMSKREITAKFDEIVAFAELEKFIDTPVKHYSSGMYVRLAFAVAAHLEPEILLVDEVLAVGDINFQKKCLGKMGDVARAGRTVVLVTHQMNQIRRLCHRVVWVDGGAIRKNGRAAEVVSAYEQAMAGGERLEGSKRPEGVKARFLTWQLKAQDSEPHTLSTFGQVSVNLELELMQTITNAVYGIALFSSDRQLIWATSQPGVSLPPGKHTFAHSFPTLPVKPGSYQWQVSLWDGGEKLDLWDCAPDMIVATKGHQHYLDEWNGILNLPADFSLQGSESRID